MSQWAEYSHKVLGDVPLRAAYQSWQFHMPTVGYLLKFRPPPARVLSIGCNLGLFDAVLVAHGYSVTSVDNDPQVLEAARELNRRFGFGLHFEQADAFDLALYENRFDVAYSAGLVEHWHGRETVRLLREHARCAPVIQVEVPTKWTWRIENITAVAEDMHVYGVREFSGRIREAGLKRIKIYALGTVPSRVREIAESVIPPYIFRRLQLLTGLSMGIGVVAARKLV